MPICFKCGKELATEQSLQYHLQKRVPCNTLVCPICKKHFPNKILLQNHMHECKETSNNSSLRYDIFDQIQTKNIFIIELNNDYHIKYISNNFETELKYVKEEKLNLNINNIIDIEDNLKQKDKFAKKTIQNKHFLINIKYLKNSILLVKTLM